jgi:hypothetical protein
LKMHWLKQLMGAGYEIRETGSVYLHIDCHGFGSVLRGGVVMSEWIGWNGGECPVHPNTVVEVIGYGCYGKSFRHEDKTAGHLDWYSDDDGSIVAYRVIKEHKLPREFWIFVNTYGGVDCVLLNDEKPTDGWTKIHVREVLDENS